MRVLLDECLPTALWREFADFDVRTVQFMGWSGLRNGELMSRMLDEEFDAFITADQNLQFQQNLRERKISVIEIAAPNNRLESLLPVVERIRAALRRIRPGELLRIDA